MLSGFTHRCRNLLNGMKMSLYFVRKEAGRPAPCAVETEVEQTYATIEQLFDRLQSIYRPVTLTPVHARLRLPGRAIVNGGGARLFRAGGAVLEIVRPLRGMARGEFDPSYLSLGLDAFVSLESGLDSSTDETARLTWTDRGSDFEVVWEETHEPEVAFSSIPPASTGAADVGPPGDQPSPWRCRCWRGS